MAPGSTVESDESSQTADSASTTMQHYAVVESDHPYKPATVANFKVHLLVLHHSPCSHPLCGGSDITLDDSTPYSLSGWVAE